MVHPFLQRDVRFEGGSRLGRNQAEMSFYVSFCTTKLNSNFALYGEGQMISIRFSAETVLDLEGAVTADASDHQSD